MDGSRFIEVHCPRHSLQRIKIGFVGLESAAHILGFLLLVDLEQSWACPVGIHAAGNYGGVNELIVVVCSESLFRQVDFDPAAVLVTPGGGSVFGEIEETTRPSTHSWSPINSHSVAIEHFGFIYWNDIGPVVGLNFWIIEHVIGSSKASVSVRIQPNPVRGVAAEDFSLECTGGDASSIAGNPGSIGEVIIGSAASLHAVAVTDVNQAGADPGNCTRFGFCVAQG